MCTISIITILLLTFSGDLGIIEGFYIPILLTKRISRVIPTLFGIFITTIQCILMHHWVIISLLEDAEEMIGIKDKEQNSVSVCP